MCERFKFTNPELQKRIRAASGTAAEFADTELPGLTAYVGQTGELKFFYRTRIRGKRSPQEKLGKFTIFQAPMAEGEENFGATEAREAAKRQRQIWEAELIPARRNRARNVPLLNDWIDTYTSDRLAGKVEVWGKSREEAKILPGNWTETTRQIRLMYKPLLTTPITMLTRDGLHEAETTYLDVREKATGKRPDSSIRNALAPLLQIISYGIQCKWTPADEFQGMAVGGNGERDRYLLPGEWQRIAPVLDGLFDYSGLFIRFLLYTGARRNMVANMKWTDVRVQSFALPGGQRREILVWTAVRDSARRRKAKAAPDKLRSGMKYTKVVQIPIVGAALRVYNQLAALCPDEGDNRIKQPTVFPERISKRWTSGQAGHKRGPAAQIKQRSGTHSWHRHDLRRTHASYKEMLGIPKAEIGSGLGHASAKRTVAAERSSATDVYAKGARKFVKIAEGYERLHALLDDIEHGRLTEQLEILQSEIAIDDIALCFIHELEIDPALIQIVPAPPRMQLVAVA